MSSLSTSFGEFVSNKNKIFLDRTVEWGETTSATEKKSRNRIKKFHSLTAVLFYQGKRNLTLTKKKFKWTFTLTNKHQMLIDVKVINCHNIRESPIPYAAHQPCEIFHFCLSFLANLFLCDARFSHERFNFPLLRTLFRSMSIWENILTHLQSFNDAQTSTECEKHRKWV
jgi:hypothetical protein